MVGIEWCTELASQILERLSEIPSLEVISDNFAPDFGYAAPQALLDAIALRRVPVLLHSVNLSVGSLEPLNRKYVENLVYVRKLFPTAILMSDHLCLTQKDGSEIGQLTPLPYNTETLKCVVEKVRYLQDAFALPFLLENIAYAFKIPGQEYSEPDFFCRIMEETGCSLLLDLNNLYTNGVNFGEDPLEWISQVPMDQVKAIHLAGGYYDTDGQLMDGHCSQVPDPVWSLYEHVMRQAQKPIPTIVERTGNNAELGLKPILEDQNKARDIQERMLV